MLFQFPGALLSSLAGIGAVHALKDPPAWLHAITASGAHVVPPPPPQAYVLVQA